MSNVALVAVLAAFVGLSFADVYMHNPRGSNNRLNERSANRNNGNRMFDSQNNNRGGYNKGDTSAGGGFGVNQNQDQYDFVYYMSTKAAYETRGKSPGISQLNVEWTNQHGCGGNEHDDPHKLNCNINLQYMCEPDHEFYPSVNDKPRQDCINSCMIPAEGNEDCTGTAPACRDSGIKVQVECTAAGYVWGPSKQNDPFNCPHACTTPADADTNAQCTGAWAADAFNKADNGNEPHLWPRDGTTTNRQNFQNGNGDPANRIGRRNADVEQERGLHEPWEWYDECSRRERNKGLFTADQNLRGNSAVYTRQNPNNNRRGYECPEERDYWPYWHDSPWKDIVIMTDRLDLCPFFKAESQNVKSKFTCRATQACPNCVQFNNEAQCKAQNGNWLETASHGIPSPECIKAPWSRVNHLGNGRDGQANTYNWTLPFVGNPKTNEGVPQRCVLRLRYNISTDDYNPWVVNSSFNQNNGQGIKSPVQQNPAVNIGSTNTALRLAINTAQFGRTFQDRSHVFLLRPRDVDKETEEFMGARHLYNLNVRGKRGNIVQTFPAVEYDFQPNHLETRSQDLVHVQWAGSNTHNNGNPAGDGQAGDAGEGRGGTDRHNFVEVNQGGDGGNENLGASFPSTHEESTMFANMEAALNPNVATRTVTKAADTNLQKTRDNWALRMASGGFYTKTEDIGADGQDELNNLLNNVKASYEGGVFRFAKGQYNYMCTRNNNFSNRDQMGYLKVE